MLTLKFMEHKRKIEYADDDTESVVTLIRLRLPVLFIGLVLGIFISFLTSRFEEVLSHNIRAAFFLPFIAYIAAAVGTQTEAIYTRDLKSGKARFHNYLVKETALGMVIGLLFGIISWFILRMWLQDPKLGLSVGISVAVVVACAPLIALLVAETSKRFKQDPAADTGPLATVIQDMISVIIFGLVCSVILL